jgi:NAD-dependent deacetylase
VPLPRVRPTAPRVARIAPFAHFSPLRITSGVRVFILTGAGISAESGIRTFRDANGLWEQHRFEEVASPQGWANDPELVGRFYAERRAQAAGCEPNAAHRALAALERVIGGRLFLCTQNVDDLHEKAGHGRVVHMHGELRKSRCEACARPPFEDIRTDATVPRCPCGASIRPHIVWFGEMPLEMGRITNELDRCDLFVTIGSSGAVYPAAGFVSHVRARPRRDGAVVTTVYIGPEEPDNASMFDECRLGRAGDAVPSLFEVCDNDS